MVREPQNGFEIGETPSPVASVQFVEKSSPVAPMPIETKLLRPGAGSQNSICERTGMVVPRVSMREERTPLAMVRTDEKRRKRRVEAQIGRIEDLRGDANRQRLMPLALRQSACQADCDFSPKRLPTLCEKSGGRLLAAREINLETRIGLAPVVEARREGDCFRQSRRKAYASRKLARHHLDLSKMLRKAKSRVAERARVVAIGYGFGDGFRLLFVWQATEREQNRSGRRFDIFAAIVGEGDINGLAAGFSFLQSLQQIAQTLASIARVAVRCLLHFFGNDLAQLRQQISRPTLAIVG
jgi:hypothetical protein